MRRRSRTLGLAGGVMLLGCAQILGFEDHELGSIDATSGGSGGDSGGSSGSGGSGEGGSTSGGSGGVLPSGGTGGFPAGSGGVISGGSGGTGGVSGSAGGSGGSAGSGGGAGSGGTCTLCQAATALAHRYSFDGSGTEATDSVGDRHGTLIGTSLSGSGDVVLSGTNQYVDLPNGIVSALEDASFEAWITWSGTAAWQRIFDFGSAAGGVEDMRGTGEQYLFLSPRAVNASGTMRVAYATAGAGSEVVVNAANSLAAGEMSQVVVVITGSTLQLYRNGIVEGFAGPIGPLSAINDINNWLGRSQYSNDSDFAGTIHEFRIYASALSAEQVSALFEAGPDTSFEAP